MTCPPLAIVQVRMRSTRLSGKAMLPLADGRPILAHVVGRTIEAFGWRDTVVATTADEANAPIVEWCRGNEVQCVEWDGPEGDVLGRFLFVAQQRRWRREAVIVRITADDPFKQVEAMRRVAAGERLPPEVGGEAFTLEMLQEASWQQREREHLGNIWNLPPAMPCPPGVWTVDTHEQYEAAVERSRQEMREADLVKHAGKAREWMDGFDRKADAAGKMRHTSGE